MPRLDRKQERIVRTLEGPLFVSAGAGSGKTFTLTQRVLWALTPGSKPREEWADPNVPEAFLDSIDQVLAITFTDKAASELKERIRAALIAEGLDAQAERVDGSWISTIHGMCARIIRAHALDLGVDPAFAVADYADDLKRLAAEHVIRRLAERAALRDAGEDVPGAGAFDELVGAFQIESAAAGSHDLDSLLKIVIAIMGKVSSSTSGLEVFCQVEPRPAYRRLTEAYREIAEAPSYANNAAARVAAEALDAWAVSPRALADLRACFAACDKLNLRARGMGKDEKDAVAEVRAARGAFFADAYLAARKDALDELIPLAREVEREYTALKRERGTTPRCARSLPGASRWSWLTSSRTPPSSRWSSCVCSAAPTGASSARWAMPNSPSTASAGRTCRSFAPKRTKSNRRAARSPTSTSTSAAMRIS